MTKDDCFNLGYIARRVGNKGELAFILDVDTPSRYQKLESVFVERNNSLVPFFIKKIQLRGNTATVTIDGIDSIDRAEELVKSGLYLPLSFLPPLSGKKFYFHELPGFTVIDKVYGEVGIIQSVLDFPQQAIFQIKKGDQEILIPAKEEFIVSIDRNARRVEIAAPEGLIDIYVSNKEQDESEKETDID
ncbi:MAG: 16S rRNA processing protein RimM [Bacteroidetes bacterium]|nr:16S rRNA processing protein RimM [Bacteroidota bacterium]